MTATKAARAVPRIPKLSPAASRKLWDLFSQAELAWQFKQTPHAEYLRRAAHQQIGQTKRVLLQVAALGPDAEIWMGVFINWMENQQNHADSTPGR